MGLVVHVRQDNTQEKQIAKYKIFYLYHWVLFQVCVSEEPGRWFYFTHTHLHTHTKCHALRDENKNLSKGKYLSYFTEVKDNLLTCTESWYMDMRLTGYQYQLPAIGLTVQRNSFYNKIAFSLYSSLLSIRYFELGTCIIPDREKKRIERKGNFIIDLRWYKLFHCTVEPIHVPAE